MKQLWHSPTLRSVVVLGASGAGFAGANLILARVLPTEQYALFTLVIALGNIGYSLAPAGVDGVVNRRHLEAGPSLLGKVMAAATLVGLIFAAIGAVGYGLPGGLVAMLWVSAAAGGAMMVAGAQLQSERRFGISLALIQSPNIVLLVAAVAAAVGHVTDAWPPVLISTLGFVAAAAYAWAVLLGERHGKPHRSSAFSWREALSFAGLSASGLILIQMERLVIPYVLPIENLAVYGVLGAIVGSLFRVLQMGVGYTLLPRLRAAGSVVERRRLIAHEARLVGGVLMLGSAFVWFVTPLVERWFLAGKYHLAGSLLLAAIVSGIAKIAHAFTRATAAALADVRELSLINAFGWASVGISAAAAWAGASWGLAGLIYGVGLGWLLHAAATTVLIQPHLRLPAPVPTTTP